MLCNLNKTISSQEILNFFEEGDYSKITYYKPSSKYKYGFTEKGESVIKIYNNNQNIVIVIFCSLIRKENITNIETNYSEKYTLYYSNLTNKIYLNYRNSLGSYGDGFHLINYNNDYLEFMNDNSNCEILNKECVIKKYFIEKKIINFKLSYLFTDSFDSNSIPKNNNIKLNLNSIFTTIGWSRYGNKINSEINTLFLWSEAKGWNNNDFKSFPTLPKNNSWFNFVNVIIPDGNADPNSRIKPTYSDIFDPVNKFYTSNNNIWPLKINNINVSSWINIYFGETKDIVKKRMNNILTDKTIMSNLIGISFDLESVSGSDWTLQEAVDYVENLSSQYSLKKAWTTGPLSIRKETSPKNLGKTTWDYLWAQFYTIGKPYDEYLYNSTCKPKNNQDFVNGLEKFPNVTNKNITNMPVPVPMLCGGGDCQTTSKPYGYCIDERLCDKWLTNFISSKDYSNFINDSGMKNLAVYYGTYGGLLPPPQGGGPDDPCCNECGGQNCIPSC